MNIETVFGDSKVKSIQFPDYKKELIDIDCIFFETNKSYASLLDSLGIENDRNITSHYNKRIYTHEFMKNVIEFIKNRDSELKPYFYSNTLTKDTFRNSVIKKLRSTFGFLVWEDIYDLKRFSEKILEKDCNTVSGIEIMFNTNRRDRSFKQIKKHLEKMGLTNLKDVYLQNITNKLYLLK